MSFRNFACLTIGDIIPISYNQKIYNIKVLETRPANPICIIEADLEVDFAPPPGYVDPFEKSQVFATLISLMERLTTN